MVDAASGVLAVIGARLSDDGQVVTLSTEEQVPERAYTLTAAGLSDLHQNVLVQGSASFVGFGTIDHTPPARLTPAEGSVVSLTRAGASSPGAPPDFLPDAADVQPVTLAWTSRSGATGYVVQLATTADFSAFGAQSGPLEIRLPRESVSLQFPDAAHATPTLEPLTYWWRVRADGASPPFDAMSAGSFDALAGALWVSCPSTAARCDDAGRVGNRSKPLQTIGGAIARAHALGRQRVNVSGRGAGAVYAEGLSLVAEVSLYGGYSSEGTSRDPAAFSSVIRSDDQTQMAADSLTTGTTVLDGFTIGGSQTPGRTQSVGLSVTSCNDSLVVRNNHIIAGSSGPTDSSCSLAIGIEVRGAADGGAGPLFEGNLVENLGCTAGGSAELTGVKVSSASAVFRGNTIDSGDIHGLGPPVPTAAWRVIGFWAAESQTLLVGNTIRARSVLPPAPTTTASWGLSGGGGTMMVLVNNVLLAGKSRDSEGIYLQAGTNALFANNTVVTTNDDPTSRRVGIALWSNPVTTGPPVSWVVNNLVVLSTNGNPGGPNAAVVIRQHPSLPLWETLENNGTSGFTALVASDGLTSIAAAGGVTDVGAVAFGACPNSTAAWCLPQGHAALSAGKTLTGSTCPVPGPAGCGFDTDFLGRARTAPWALGAFED